MKALFLEKNYIKFSNFSIFESFLFSKVYTTPQLKWILYTLSYKKVYLDRGSNFKKFLEVKNYKRNSKS